MKNHEHIGSEQLAPYTLLNLESKLRTMTKETWIFTHLQTHHNEVLDANLDAINAVLDPIRNAIYNAILDPIFNTIRKISLQNTLHKWFTIGIITHWNAIFEEICNKIWDVLCDTICDAIRNVLRNTFLLKQVERIQNAFTLRSS